MNRGEVWWARLQPGSGGEMQKSRPVVIVSNNLANVHLNRVQAVPLTTNVSRVYPGEALITVKGNRRKALATQLTTIDKGRLTEKVGALSPADMMRVEVAIREQLDIP